jgi:beta-lactamase class A
MGDNSMHGDNVLLARTAEEEGLLVPETLWDRRRFLITAGLAAGTVMTGVPDLAEAARGASLQGQVVRLVKRMRAQGVIRSDEETSWSVYDFSGRKKLVSINEDMPRQAASMIKPFVAQAVFYTIANRRSGLRYTSSIRDTMEQMIRRSSNPATTELMQIVSRYNGNAGPKATEQVLKRNAPSIFQQTRIVEYIPSNGRTYRNLASARDYSRFLYALWHNSMPNARELLDVMALPNNDRIASGVYNMPSNVRVYDKTGSTARLCGNMGVIECRDRRGRPRPYTFIGIIEKSNRTTAYGAWITKRSAAMRQVSGLVYSHMRDAHSLA